MTDRPVRRLAVLAVALALAGTASPAADPASPRDAVLRTERAFARTMAERDHAAFARFLADDAVFVSSGTVLRGKDEVARAWKPFFDGDEAPFSWEPEIVEVLAAGNLALSTGPVRDATGRAVGTFNSIWRLEPDGAWRIVFDRGCPPCGENRP